MTIATGDGIALRNGGSNNGWANMFVRNSAAPSARVSSERELLYRWMDALRACTIWGGQTDPHWTVFKNTGIGFSKTGTKWPVPKSPGVAIGFSMPSYSGSSPVLSREWSMVDMNKDGRPDLVWTADPAVHPVTIWGGTVDPQWKVFLNTGTGFALTSTKWVVPAGPTTGFHALYDSKWLTMDMNGDGRPDIVWTEDPLTSAIFGGQADANWRVYVNSGSGFSKSILKWVVPWPASANIPEGFDVAFQGLTAKKWSTIDLNGDGLPELVWTSQANIYGIWGGQADPHWEVFANSKAGFSKTLQKWVVPASPGITNGFDATAGSRWSTFDINGDGRPDLVWTADPAAQNVPWGAPADPYWRVYLGKP